MKRIDLSGHRFGKLVVQGYAGSDEKGLATWQCLCDCGGEKIAKSSNLRRGHTTSCGCVALSQRRNAAQSQAHALSKSAKPKEYGAWDGMKRRCYSEKHPSFSRYGARGIGVCAKWRNSFAAFFSDMEDAPEGAWLERIDNDKDYSPDNCRWASAKEQANNRRSNRLLTLNGITLNIQQWSERLGWHKSVITSRLHNGWPVERALTEPPRKRHR